MTRFKKTLFFALFGLMALQTPLFAEDKPVTFEQLPQSAQLLIKENFSSLTVARATFDSDRDDNNYEVMLSDSTTIEFDKNGNWTEIECQNAAVPANLVPEAIAQHVAEKYAGATIQKIEKEDNRIEVTLSTNEEITFNARFEVIEVDMD